MHPDKVKENTTPEQIRSLRANDEKALQLFYQKNYANVERYVIENSGSEDEAKDIYQEAFIAVWRNLQAGKFNDNAEAGIDGYLYQVAKFKWIDHLRSVKRKPLVPLDDDAPGFFSMPDADQEDEEKISNIRRYFAQLGENCKDILTRFYYQKQSMKTIAHENGWTEPTAKNNKYRCLQKLRDLLKNN